jgi:hypothetical protein
MFELREQGFGIRKIADALDVDKGLVERYFKSLKPAKDAASKRKSSETRQTENIPPADEVIEQVEMFSPADVSEPEAAAAPESEAEPVLEAEDSRPEPEPGLHLSMARRRRA